MQRAARGRALADELIASLRTHAAALAHVRGRPATLAIVATDDEAGRRFVRIKQTALADVVLAIEPVWLVPDADTASALRAITRLNERPEVDTIFLQFPLPPGIDAQQAANAVRAGKDIDCSSTIAQQQFLAGSSPFVPVAPQAALQLLHNELHDLQDLRVLVAGNDDPFLRVLRKLLRDAGAVPVPANSAGALAALVVTDTPPPPGFIAEFEQVRVLLDAGYYLPPRPENWLSANDRRRVAVHLTQYGNVGPLTVACLAQATVTAAQRAGRD